MSIIFSLYSYSIRQVSKKLLGDLPEVLWRGLICNNFLTPMSKIIVWTAIIDKLPTINRLSSWGISCNRLCLLGDIEDES